MTDLTYVIADLHGRSDLLKAALKAIVHHGDCQPAGERTVVTLGDYIDRGPDSKGVVETLMNGLASDWELVCLMGNHENMMLDALGIGSNEHHRLWMMNGGDATIASYPDKETLLGHADWMRQLPMIYQDPHRIYVHADINPHETLDEQDPGVLLWSRHCFSQNGYAGKHVTVGHTPHRANPRTVGLRTDLDTGAYQTGRLAVAIFDDIVPGGPYDFLPVEGPVGVRRIYTDADLYGKVAAAE